MFILRVPNNVCFQIDQLSRRFWWNVKLENHITLHQLVGIDFVILKIWVDLVSKSMNKLT